MARELVGEWQVPTCLGPPAAPAPQPGPLVPLNDTHARPIGDDDELNDQQELLCLLWLLHLTLPHTCWEQDFVCMVLQTGPDYSLQTVFGAFKPDFLAQAMLIDYKLKRYITKTTALGN